MGGAHTEKIVYHKLMACVCWNHDQDPHYPFAPTPNCDIALNVQKEFNPISPEDFTNQIFIDNWQTAQCNRVK